MKKVEKLPVQLYSILVKHGFSFRIEDPRIEPMRKIPEILRILSGTQGKHSQSSTYVHRLEYTVEIFTFFSVFRPRVGSESGSRCTIFDSQDMDRTKKCSGSGSVGALCFWASWIRIWIVIYLYGSDSGSGSFHQQAKKEEKPLFLLFSDCFKTFIFEEWCKYTYKKVTDEKSKIRSRIL